MQLEKNDKNLILYNTASQILAKVFSVIITGLVVVLISRNYGKQGYGEFALMQNIPALFFILSDFGLNATALKKLGKNQDVNFSKDLYETIIALRIVISIALVIILNFIVYFFPYSQFLKTGIFMSSFWVITHALFSSTNIVFQHKQRYDLASLGVIMASLFTLISVVGVIKMGLDVRFVSFVYVITSLANFLFNLILANKIGIKTKINIRRLKEKYLISQLLKASFPIGLTFIFSQINFKVDSLLISVMKLPTQLNLDNISSVAIYGLGYKVFEVSLSLPTFIMNSTYPIYINKASQNKHNFKEFFKKSVFYILVVGVIYSLLLFILSPYIISIFGGAQFAKSNQVLKILSLGLPVFFLTQPFSYFLVTLEKQKYLPIIYFIGAFFNISANLIFIPKYGFFASAYITWISEALILTLLFFACLKEWKN